MPEPPKSYTIDQEIGWDSQWVEVLLRVELPFWLMTDDVVVQVEEGGHVFPVSVNGETFELHVGEISDAKRTCIYVGPHRKRGDLSPRIEALLDSRPDLNVLWRKCKTVLKITTRCKESVLNKELERHTPYDRDERPGEHNAGQIFLQELCRIHLPIINKLIQGYRLATYDYFAFEVAPWDVPVWRVERNGDSIQCRLVPYRGWDHRPLVGPWKSQEPPNFYTLIDGHRLQAEMQTVGTPGELEVMDALNLMERGDYSGAVRRITTALEVVVEAIVEREIELAEGGTAAAKFLQLTKTNFPKRIIKYEALSGRFLPGGLKKRLEITRRLRHRIVHGGYRIQSGERGTAQMAVDTGRWIFNWFENSEQRRQIREKQIAFRSLGRALTSGIFASKITPDGVVLSPFSAEIKPPGNSPPNAEAV
jgi:hypothetical protein